MSKILLHKLLVSFRDKAPIDNLISYGIEYSQIYELISIAIDNNYIEQCEDQFIVTNDGINFINTTKVAMTQKRDWIEPEHQSKIDSIGKNDIFIPSLKTIQKLK